MSKTYSDQILAEATPNPHSLGKQRKVVDYLVRYLQEYSPFRVSQIVVGGSIGMGTTESSRADIDLVLMSPELGKTDHKRWLRGKLEELKTVIEKGSSEEQDIQQFPPIGRDPPKKIPKCTGMFITRFALQFKCSGCEVDLLISYDWELDPQGYRGLYSLCCDATDEETGQWYSAGAVKRQVKFISDQDNEIKDVIKILKHWNKKMVQWGDQHKKPKSYLLSLLVVRAAERLQRSYHGDWKSRIIGELARLIKQQPLSIAWSTFYDPNKYQWLKVPQRLIRDPANPVNNVAATGLTDWSQFIREAERFARSLGQSV
jgi:hypothetical protein